MDTYISFFLRSDPDSSARPLFKKRCQCLSSDFFCSHCVAFIWYSTAESYFSTCNLKIEYDRRTVNYPIPFDVLFHNKSMRYVNFGACPSSFPSFIHCGQVSRSVYDQSFLFFITGSSENHFYATINCLYSIVAANINASMLFIDYGISSKQIRALLRHYTQINQFHKQTNSGAQLYYRKYNFVHFPPFMDISEFMSIGGYSWKVIGYSDVIDELRGPIMWTDGGSILLDDMSREISLMQKYGIYSPASLGTVDTWVHPSSRMFLEKYGLIKGVNGSSEMCTGGYLFIDGGSEKIRKEIIEPLLECSYTMNCITPLLSNRMNHRQDQAILTLLIHNAGIEKSCDSRFSYVPLLRRDCLSRSMCLPFYKDVINRIRTKYRLD